MVLFQAGGALEGAQTDAAAVGLVARVDAGMSREECLGLQTLPTHAAGQDPIRGRGLIALGLFGVHQGLVAFQLVLTAELAATDVAEVRPLPGVRLEVDRQLRAALELFAAEVAKQRAGWRGLGSAANVCDLLVVLKVISAHVSLGTEVTAVGFDP